MKWDAACSAFFCCKIEKKQIKVIKKISWIEKFFMLIFLKFVINFYILGGICKGNIADQYGELENPLYLDRLSATNQ